MILFKKFQIKSRETTTNDTDRINHNFLLELELNRKRDMLQNCLQKYTNSIQLLMWKFCSIWLKSNIMKVLLTFENLNQTLPFGFSSASFGLHIQHKFKVMIYRFVTNVLLKSCLNLALLGKSATTLIYAFRNKRIAFQCQTSFHFSSLIFLWDTQQ